MTCSWRVGNSRDAGDLFSYSLAYHRLMPHWRELLPGRFVDVDYEALVRDPEAGTRGLLSARGLDWEPQCLEFHANGKRGAGATAYLPELGRALATVRGATGSAAYIPDR